LRILVWALASQTRAAARDRDHRSRLLFAEAFISVATVEASTGPVIRIQPPVANSISIAGDDPARGPQDLG
jgi:hypothetical protein